VSAADSELSFRVEDDGAGFRTDETGFGTGLQGMSDRLEAVGGTLDVGSEPGRGTTVTGVIRVREPGPVRSPDDPGASSSGV